eukprot:3628569-Pleurochrysis_carterae.AAC.1
MRAGPADCAVGAPSPRPLLFLRVPAPARCLRPSRHGRLRHPRRRRRCLLAVRLRRVPRPRRCGGAPAVAPPG